MALKTYRYKLSPPICFGDAVTFTAVTPASTTDATFEEEVKDAIDARMRGEGWEFVEEVV
jgi:hypothetical protein